MASVGRQTTFLGQPAQAWKRIGITVGFALLFWFCLSLVLALPLTLLGVNQQGRSVFYLAALIFGGVYGYRRSRRTAEAAV